MSWEQRYVDAKLHSMDYKQWRAIKAKKHRLNWGGITCSSLEDKSEFLLCGNISVEARQ